MSRPKGIPMSPEVRAKISAAAKARWAEPGYRAKMTAALSKTIPRAREVWLAKVGGRDGARRQLDRIRERLPPMSPEERRIYKKIKGAGIPRSEALRAVLA